MIDLYLFNTIINTIWYIFTVLFVLYKFTSFFSYIYNFFRFCGKLFNGIYYVYDQIKIYIRKRRGYIYLPSDDDIEANDILLPEQRRKHKTIFETCKDYISRKYDYYYYKIFGRQRTVNNRKRDSTHINLTETTISSNYNNNSRYNDKETEQTLFDKQISELCANNSSIEFNDYVNQHKRFKQSYTSDNNDDHMFHTINLNGVDSLDNLENHYFDPNRIIKNGSSYYDDSLYISKTDQADHIGNVYNIQNSDILFNSSFINKLTTATQTNSELNNSNSELNNSKPESKNSKPESKNSKSDNVEESETNPLINNYNGENSDLFRNDVYPVNIKGNVSRRSFKSSMESIYEEEENVKSDTDKPKKRGQELVKQKVDDTSVKYLVGSVWTSDIEDTVKFGNENNSSLFARHNISYSMIDNYKSLDSDDEYTNEILKNPYI